LSWKIDTSVNYVVKDRMVLRRQMSNRNRNGFQFCWLKSFTSWCVVFIKNYLKIQNWIEYLFSMRNKIYNYKSWQVSQTSTIQKDNIYVNWQHLYKNRLIYSFWLYAFNCIFMW
jgi:hypothetical protein